jgi:hypothetical protein
MVYIMSLKFEVIMTTIKIVYNKHSQLHRGDDKPAIIYHDGTQYWYQYGKRHRDDGPAMVYIDGTNIWYHHGIKQNKIMIHIKNIFKL